MLIGLQNVTFEFGARAIVTDATWHIQPGERIGLIGYNGTGKSTLLKLLVGQYTPSKGTVEKGRDTTIGYLHQDLLSFDTSETITEVALGAFERVRALEKEIEALGIALEANPEDNDILIKYTDALHELDVLDGYNIEHKAEEVLHGLGFTTKDLTRPYKEFSGGWRMRVLLAKMILQAPDVLLLDEPTNHLDAESIDWLEQHLQQYKGTVIAVTHDRYFLDNVAGWILELDRGEGIPWKGNYTSWLEQKGKRLQEEEKSESKRQKMLARELEWVRMNPKARQAKSKARLQNYDKMLSEDAREKEAKLEMPIPNGPRLGNNVIDALHVGKAFGDKLLYDDLNFKLPPAGIVGIIGPNGAGKTTIFKMIMAELTPDKGEFTVGDTVKIGYVDQSHKDIHPDKTVFDVVSNGLEYVEVGNQKINSRAYLSKFNFNGSDQNKKVGILSGGERNRLHLAMTLKTEANVLLLDEPTNDIDVNTLRALEEGIENFAGCAVVISHDRWFLDRICTHILAFEGDSQVYWFEGSYSEYEENRKKRLGDAGPKRIRYRSLS